MGSEEHHTGSPLDLLEGPQAGKVQYHQAHPQHHGSSCPEGHKATQPLQGLEGLLLEVGHDEVHQLGPELGNALVAGLSPGRAVCHHPPPEPPPYYCLGRHCATPAQRGVAPVYAPKRRPASITGPPPGRWSPPWPRGSPRHRSARPPRRPSLPPLL